MYNPNIKYQLFDHSSVRLCNSDSEPEATTRMALLPGFEPITPGQGDDVQGNTLATYLFIIVMDYINWETRTIKQNSDCSFCFPDVLQNLRSSGANLTGQSIFEVRAASTASVRKPAFVPDLSSLAPASLLSTARHFPTLHMQMIPTSQQHRLGQARRGCRTPD